MSSHDDEIRFTLDALRLLAEGVESRLLVRGWAVADLDVGDSEPLEWFWPPTAPIAYANLPEWSDETMQRRPGTHGPRRTPWKRPTRITRTGPVWLVEYGEAIAKEPDPPQEYQDEAALLADLECIECWPMTVEESRQVRMKRVYATTTAATHDDHHQAVFLTEPYASSIDKLREHLSFERERDHGSGDAKSPSTPRPRGDLHAQMRLVDAEAWASAVRTARVGGDGWDTSGPRP